MDKDWFVNMLLMPVQSSRLETNCCLPFHKILKAAMFPAPSADHVDDEMMKQLEALFTASDAPVAEAETGGAVDIDIDELKRRREAEWRRELDKLASAIEAVNCRADVKRTWYDAKLKELREQEVAKELEDARLKE